MIAGVVLLAASLGATLFITHHPTLGSQGFDNLASEAVAESGLNGVVHGGMILFSLAFYFGLSTLSQQLNTKQTDIQLAQLSISIATITMVGAALISGFIVPGIAEHFSENNTANNQLFQAQLTSLGETNQVLAKTGTIGYGAAIFFYSLGLIRMQGFPRAAGILGCLVGPLLLVSIFSGYLTLNVFGMGVVLVVIGIWFSIVALLMISKKI